MSDTTTPPERQDVYFLHSAAEVQPAITLGQGLPDQINGQPAKYFHARGIQIGGKYRHPVKGFTLEVPPERVNGWLKNWSRMQDKGIRVPVCADHSLKAKDAMGHVVSLQRSGDWLNATFVAVGDDAIRAAARNEVSLGIDPSYIDGTGEKIGEAITHLAITPIPVIPGQNGILAASRADGGEGAMIFTLSAQEPPTRSTDMSPELRKKILALTGATEDTADDVLLSRLVEETEAQRDDILTLKERVDLSRAEVTEVTGKLATANEAVTAAQTERDAAKQQVVTLSREQEENLQVMYERGLRVGERFDKLVGKYTPADVKRLKTIILGNEANPNIFALSRDAGSKEDCIAAQIADVLLEVKPAPTPGEKTPVQTLSRQEPASPEEPTATAAEKAQLDAEVARLRQMAHLPEKAAK